MSPSDGALPEVIVESIAISNAKAIGEQPAILANLAPKCRRASAIPIR